MSAGAVTPRCERCGHFTYDLRHNRLIGGWYCVRCDLIITTPDAKLEANYERRVVERQRKEASA